MLKAKGVGNITPQEIMEALSNFGLQGEDAEDILIQVGAILCLFVGKQSR